MKINIKGVIISNDMKWIYDWFGIDNVSPNDVSSQIEKANGEDLDIEINSGGGDVYAGSEIFTSIKDYKGDSIAKIVGVAASAAGVAAMAAKKLLISPTAQIMVHNVASAARGDYRALEHEAQVIKNYNVSIANAYKLKTGMKQEDLLDLMNKETWLNAQQAKELRFVDEIMFDPDNQLVASFNKSAMLPVEVINKMRNEFKKEGLLNPLVHNQGEPSNKKEEPKLLTFEQLKNEHPDLYNQARNEGQEAGIQAERKRIQAIDDLAMPGNEELVNKAKFESGISAEQVAMEIIKAEKQRGTNFLTNRQQEADQLNNVDGSAAPQNAEKEEQERQDVVKNMVGGAKKLRGAE